jgi:nitrogen fixation NifU-like protein
MGDLRDLYQEVILDHSRNPKNFGELEGATHRAEGYNPLCGDQGRSRAPARRRPCLGHQVPWKGCAISTASASLMTEALKGKTVDEALALFRKVHDAVTGQPTDELHGDSGLGKLAVLEGVKQYPLRVKCATLAWHALHNALTGNDATLPLRNERAALERGMRHGREDRHEFVD